MYSLVIVLTLVSLLIYLIVDGVLEKKRTGSTEKITTPGTVTVILGVSVVPGDNILALDPGTGNKLVGLVKGTDPEMVMIDTGQIIPVSHVIGKIVS